MVDVYNVTVSQMYLMDTRDANFQIIGNDARRYYEMVHQLLRRGRRRCR